jgi:hypothetical protein
MLEVLKNSSSVILKNFKNPELEVLSFLTVKEPRTEGSLILIVKKPRTQFFTKSKELPNSGFYQCTSFFTLMKNI